MLKDQWFQSDIIAENVSRIHQLITIDPQVGFEGMVLGTTVMSPVMVEKMMNYYPILERWLFEAVSVWRFEEEELSDENPSV